jgi:hypothetical protein
MARCARPAVRDEAVKPIILVLVLTIAAPALAVALTCSQASADDLIGIRCVGYEEPIPRPAFTSRRENEVERFYTRDDAKFDVFISPSRGIGWWESSAAIKTDEEHPAKLVKMHTTSYWLEITTDKIDGRRKWTEWLVLDRIEGTVVHYARIEGHQSEQLKRGGKCSKLEPKFLTGDAGPSPLLMQS